MEKQLSLTSNGIVAKRLAETMKKAAGAALQCGEMLRRYYSYALEREVSKAQAKVLTEVQLAFVAAVMPADYHLALRLAACAWLAFAVRKCRKLL